MCQELSSHIAKDGLTHKGRTEGQVGKFICFLNKKKTKTKNGGGVGEIGINRQAEKIKKKEVENKINRVFNSRGKNLDLNSWASVSIPKSR